MVAQMTHPWSTSSQRVSISFARNLNRDDRLAVQWLTGVHTSPKVLELQGF